MVGDKFTVISADVVSSTLWKLHEWWINSGIVWYAMTRGYKEEMIFVNSFRGSGIGDFGWKLKCELEAKLRIKYLEITPS